MTLTLSLDTSADGVEAYPSPGARLEGDALTLPDGEAVVVIGRVRPRAG